jgi:hypothetical protein
MSPLVLVIAAVLGVVIAASTPWLARILKEQPFPPKRHRMPGTEGSPPLAPGHARVSGLTLTEAEDLLDWLEHNGYQNRTLQCEDGLLFAVDFQVDSEHPFTQATASSHLVRVRLPEGSQVGQGS